MSGDKISLSYEEAQFLLDAIDDMPPSLTGKHPDTSIIEQIRGKLNAIIPKSLDDACADEDIASQLPF